MATEAEQQLSLVPEATVQGSLFAEAAAASPPAAPAAAPADTAADLDPETLAADAAARPRQRRQPVGTPTPAASAQPCITAAPAPPAAPAAPDSDLPPWHHHGLVDPAQLTPMLRHYVELKRAHPERLLLYRLGDFFECFFEDALTVSRLLELTLTGKEAGRAIGRVPMAGIPHHAAERYCADLVRRGLSVALCDQLEEAGARSQGRGELLRRDITRVLTPGTVLEEGMLAARCNNWLCAVVLDGSAARWGLAVADVSTGEFRVSERDGSDALHQELLRLEAAEVLWPSGTAGEMPPPAAPAWCPASLRLTPLPRTPFELTEAGATLRERFGLASLDGLGLGEVPLALRAAGGLVHYLDGTQNGTTKARVPLDLPITWHAGDALVLDAATRRNLELTRTQLGGSLHGSLLWAIDRTHTAMGGRCLRRWLEAPLVERAAILERQAGVSELVGQRPLRLSVRRLLRPMADLERLAGRGGAGTAAARARVGLADGRERVPQQGAPLGGAP
ncbi:MAG: DNA mismatch repair protein MutS, partial [Synechococcaceae cyanobacterium]